ncbi:MAG: HAMP domain-containing histidine kinase [Chloroflexi bacterium]|nr:HAMP domain-containing histidine kinase [Chloroflexota bacterium]
MSLRLRLALWYGGLTGLIVLLAGLLAYAIFSRIQYDDLDQALEGAVEHAAGTYVAARTSDELATMLETPILPGLVMRIYGPGGQVLAASSNDAPAPSVDPDTALTRPSGPAYDALAGLAPPFATVRAGPGAFGLLAGSEGSRWRLYVLPLDGAGQYLVAMAPLGGIDASLARLRQLVPLLAVVAAAVTLGAGRLLAGRALRPVATLTEAAAAIERSREFGRRVPVGARRDELGQLAATFNEMLASLEGAYRAQQRFVADASHELRAPLTAIQANLELLERQPDMAPAERQEAVHEASHEAHRLARLVADLLALARADAGQPLRHQRVELDRVLLDALGEARHLAQGQRLEVARLEPALARGDPDRLKQLLLILMDNALKYTPDGGRVTVGLERNSAATEIVVCDTGVGISSQDLPHVFERFYRADPARARDPGGTGLGLSIARWIAEQHGGKITLTSAPNQGTTATVRLPLES